MISIRRILYLYVIIFIIFTETYVLFPWLQTITIINYILVLVFFLYNKKIDKDIKKLNLFLLIFILYMFLVNLFQNDLQKTFSILITSLPIIAILGVFNKYERKNEIIFFFAKFYLIYNLIFSIFQLLGIFITSNSFISHIPLFGTYRDFVGLSETQGLRISGAGSSTIGLASMLGIIFILFYFYKKGDYLLSKKERIVYLFIIFFMILLTQTRSLIFALPIVIALTNLFVSKHMIKGIITTIIFTLFTFIMIYFSLPILIEKFPRLFLTVNEDGSIIHRIQANVYGAIGTFELSPWFGVSFDDALKAMKVGYNKIGLFIGHYFIDEVTYHNQLFYFFRHYGFIGLFLYLFLILFIIRLAFKKKVEVNKKIIFAIILFYFFYTFSHNNKWTMDYYLWIFVSLHLTNNIITKEYNE